MGTCLCAAPGAVCAGSWSSHTPRSGTSPLARSELEHTHSAMTAEGLANKHSAACIHLAKSNTLNAPSGFTLWLWQPSSCPRAQSLVLPGSSSASWEPSRAGVHSQQMLPFQGCCRDSLCAHIPFKHRPSAWPAPVWILFLKAKSSLNSTINISKMKFVIFCLFSSFILDPEDGKGLLFFPTAILTPRKSRNQKEPGRMSPLMASETPNVLQSPFQYQPDLQPEPE